MMQFYRGLRRQTCAVICLLGLSLPGTAQAQDALLPTCPSVLGSLDYEGHFGPVDYDIQPDCVINSVQNDQLQRIIWRDSGDPDIVELVQTEEDNMVLMASRQPHLIDIDQDGWLDVAVFTLLGMVNGDYDIFRYDPTAERFGYFGTMTGASFRRHEGGYLVATGRSSAAASGVEAFRISNHRLVPEFGLYVDAGLQTGADGAAECRVSIAGQTYVNPDADRMAQIYPQAPNLIAEYCNFYDSDLPSGTRLMDISSNAVIVPDGTIFHCQFTDTGKTVTVTRDTDGYSYAFGPRDGIPELEMHRRFDQVSTLHDDGTGPNRYGEISFMNGEYHYTVYYAYELLGEGSTPLDIKRGLVVSRDGRDVGFEHYCSGTAAFDSLALLD